MTIIFIFMSDCVLLLFVGICLSNISSQLVFFFAFLCESIFFKQTNKKKHMMWYYSI